MLNYDEVFTIEYCIRDVCEDIYKHQIFKYTWTDYLYLPNRLSLSTIDKFVLR